MFMTRITIHDAYAGPGFMNRLVQLLGSANPRVQEQAAWTIGNMVTQNFYREHIVDPERIQARLAALTVRNFHYFHVSS